MLMYMPYDYGYVMPLNHYVTFLCVMLIDDDDNDDDDDDGCGGGGILLLRRWYSFIAFYFDVQ